ncbi:hypothetical protein AFE02nite_12410 [Actinotalea fermentans]|uniref:Uncharacterized protein n=1 Tax=Actinotalea fermentans TaxID=43671 RepID=A0A511YWC2_9CELL|nr:hypothetical protein AFE02nite_12410 [Actinotalea fermentans]
MRRILAAATGQGVEQVGDALVPRRGAVVAYGGGAPAAQSTARISFEGRMMTWADLPEAARRAAHRASPVVAESVESARLRWESSGLVEVAVGWRVYEDAVVVVEAVRPVVPRASRWPKATGPWEHRGTHVAPVAAPVRRRRGVVPVAGELARAFDGCSVPAGSAAGAALGAVQPEHRGAAEAWSYLPQVVRDAAERLVPAPTTWLGQILQRATRKGFPVSQEVRVLRMGDERAVVLLGARALAPIPGADAAFHVAQMARVPWTVEQVGLDLGAARVAGHLHATS